MVDDEMMANAKSRLEAVEQRFTTQRRALVGMLAVSENPLSMPELVTRGEGMAQSSLYRNLAVLEQAGVVRRIVTDDEFARFELAEDLTGHHHHLVCSNCGRVEDLPATAAVERSVADAVEEAARRAGFRTEHHRLDLVGLCADCTA